MYKLKGLHRYVTCNFLYNVIKVCMVLYYNMWHCCMVFADIEIACDCFRTNKQIKKDQSTLK